MLISHSNLVGDLKFHRYLHNTYQLPARMIVNGQNEQGHINSEEGSTQGDVPAMQMYAIGTRPLVDKLGDAVDPQSCKQVWYADDSAAAGTIMEVKKWCVELNDQEPKYGYYPKAAKTVFCGFSLYVAHRGPF